MLDPSSFFLGLVLGALVILAIISIWSNNVS